MAWRMFFEQVQSQSFEALHFQLDVKVGLAGKSSHHFFQAGQLETIAQRSEGVMSYVHALHMRIVADDGFAIRRAAHIELESVATVLQGEVERLEGVLRSVQLRAPVSQQQGTAFARI